MKEDYNPYAAPQTDTPLSAAVGDGEKPAIWRDGRFVIIPHGAEIPPRCWRCNSSHIEGQWKCQMSWLPPLYLLLLPLGILPLLLVAVFVQRSATFTVSLCYEHARRRRMHISIAWAISLAGIACGVAGALLLSPDPSPLVGAGVVLFILGIVYGGIMANLATPRKIDKHLAQVSGAGRPFLDSIPDAMGQTGDLGG
jgi:hypothetical protein